MDVLECTQGLTIGHGLNLATHVLYGIRHHREWDDVDMGPTPTGER